MTESPPPPPTRTAPPTPAAFGSWLDLRTRNRDTDQFGHVNHAAMATLFEEARVALVFAPDLAEETDGLDLLVASLAMSFHKELRAPGVVRLGATVTRVGTSAFDIAQGLFVDEVCHASAVAVCVLLGRETRRPTQVNHALRAALLGNAAGVAPQDIRGFHHLPGHRQAD